MFVLFPGIFVPRNLPILLFGWQHSCAFAFFPRPSRHTPKANPPTPLHRNRHKLEPVRHSLWTLRKSSVCISSTNRPLRPRNISSKPWAPESRYLTATATGVSTFFLLTARIFRIPCPKALSLRRPDPRIGTGSITRSPTGLLRTSRKRQDWQALDMAWAWQLVTMTTTAARIFTSPDFPAISYFITTAIVISLM